MPDRPPCADELTLWRRLRKQGDAVARERLLELHMPYARSIATIHWLRRSGDDMHFDDYVQFAALGLIECLDRFDPNQGVGFRVFAERRLHGSLVDGLEQFTEKQQQSAGIARLMAQRREATPESEEGNAQPPAAPVSRSTDRLLRHVADAGIGFALTWLLDGSGMALADDPVANIPFYRSTELRQLRERMLELMKQLTERERAVIRGHYFQGLTFEQIASHLGISRARVKQLHRRAIERLRDTAHAAKVCMLEGGAGV